MITAFQIKKIHTLKSLLGLDDDLYKEMLLNFGVTTSKELTYAEASVLVDILEEKAVEQNLWKIKPKKYEDLNRNKKMASQSQLRMIESLWREICYFDTDEFAKKSLRKFLASKFKVDDIMFLTKAKASKAIQAILGIKRNLQKHIEKSAATLN